MDMKWHNEPPQWSAQGDTLTVTAGPKTDFWRITHDGGARDSGNFYYQTVIGDFEASVKVSGAYAAQYDQAGLMIRLDDHNWVKCGIELFDGVQQASVVVTRNYSDWSVNPQPEPPPALWIRVTRHEATIQVYFSFDGEHYTLARQAYLTSAEVKVGVMCCAPTGEGFTATFEDFKVETH
jgi:hypothetical protein